MPWQKFEINHIIVLTDRRLRWYNSIALFLYCLLMLY